MTTFDDQFGEAYAGEQKTSGMAIASLVCSLICCLPVTTIPGVLLGIAAMVSIGNDPAKKGKGIAVTGIVLGVLFTVGQAAIYPPAIDYIKEMLKLVEKGPETALIAGFDGDIAGFKSQFHGPGAMATDAEAQAFLDQLRARYGEFELTSMRGQSQQSPFGQPIVTFDYVLIFKNTEVKCATEIAFSDPKKGGFINKLSSITVDDPDLGLLVYPPEPGDADATPAPPEPPAEMPEPPADVQEAPSTVPDEGDGG